MFVKTEKGKKKEKEKETKRKEKEKEADTDGRLMHFPTIRQNMGPSKRRSKECILFF
jgi:hypothetical protein